MLFESKKHLCEENEDFEFYIVPDKIKVLLEIERRVIALLDIVGVSLDCSILKVEVRSHVAGHTDEN